MTKFIFTPALSSVILLLLSGTERFENLRLIYAKEQVTERMLSFTKGIFPDDCLFVNRLGITETGTVAYYC
jgi:hypothetical protein